MTDVLLWRADGRVCGAPTDVDGDGIIWRDGYWFGLTNGRWEEILSHRLFGIDGDQAPCGFFPTDDAAPPPIITIDGETYLHAFRCASGWQVYRPYTPLAVETCMVMAR